MGTVTIISPLNMEITKGEIRDSVRINLDCNEALVLFEWLSREAESIEVEHYAERKVMLKLLGGLEKNLSHPFLQNYRDILANARGKVQGEDNLVP